MDKQDFIDYHGKKIFYQLAGPKEKAPGIIFLHGSEVGSSLYKIFDDLKDEFLCLIFDHLGAIDGKSEGNVNDDTITSRVEQARLMLDLLKSHNPHGVVIVAPSLGAEIASQIATDENLVLRAPATFDQKYNNIKVVDLPEKDGWTCKDSLGLKNLNNFTGNLLVIRSEKDDIIPNEMVEDFYKSAIKAKSKRQEMMKGALHYLGPFPEQIKVFSDLIREFVNEV